MLAPLFVSGVPVLESLFVAGVPVLAPLLLAGVPVLAPLFVAGVPVSDSQHGHPQAETDVCHEEQELTGEIAPQVSY